MTLEELRNRPHLSASSIADYMGCSLSFKFSRIDMIKPEFISDSLIFGSTVHQALSDYYYSKKSYNKLTVNELTSYFKHYFINSIKDSDIEVRYKEGKDQDILINEGIELLKTYYENIPDDNYQVLSVEQTFSFYIQDIPLPIIGVIDLIEIDSSSTIILTDFKTSSKSYTNTDIDNSLQLTIYDMAMRANGYKDTEILLRFDVLVKTKTPQFHQYYTTRDEIQSTKAINTIRQIWDGISKGVFIPTNEQWRCKSCPYQRHCSEYLGR